MPILNFCSQAYYPRVSSLKKLGKIQKHATAWFYGYNDNYKDRQLRCNLLPVSLYIELHDVFYLQMILNGTVDIKPSALLTINENEATRQVQRKELAVNSTRKRKTDENFVRSASILYNILSRHAQYTNVKLNKSSLTNIYWQYFVECYNEKTSCTWRILCLCGSCNPYWKLTNRYRQNGTTKWTLSWDERCPWNTKILLLLLLLIENDPKFDCWSFWQRCNLVVPTIVHIN